MEHQAALDLYREALTRLEKKLGRGGIADKVIEDASVREQRPRREYDRKKLVASIGQWVRRSSVPREATFRDSLINVVNRELAGEPAPTTPEESFAQILQEIHKRHFENSITGKAISRNLSDLFLRGIVLTPVSPANEIEQLALGLGSWKFQGELPPYVSREVDDEILNKLNEAKFGLIAISGPPKSGKTRTLIENLLLSKYRNHNVYWLSPTRGAIQGLLDAMRENKHPQSVIVLDDLQRFQFDLDSGLTLDRLNELMSIGLVVATVHSSALTRWENESFEKTKSNFDIPARPILTQIMASKVEVSAIFTNHEISIASAGRVFIDDNADTELKYLPSWLASVEVLTSRAMRMLSDGGMQSAVMRGLIDGYVLFPGGTTIEVIELLSQQHFANLQPNSIWHQEVWAQLLDSLTVGVTPQSPHSILTRVEGDLPKYLLFDAVWQNLRPETWMPISIERLAIHYRTAAGAAYSAGYWQAALNLLSPGLESEVWDDFWRAAKVAQELGDHELALRYLEQACEHDVPEALLEYGYLQEQNGLAELGRQFYLRAVNLGSAQAMENLAKLDREAGDDAAAKIWDLRAAELGHASSLFTIAHIEFEDGNFDAAVAKYIEAAELGLNEAISNLRWIYLLTADMKSPSANLEAVTEYLELKANAGDDHSKLALAEIRGTEGNISEAKSLLASVNLPAVETVMVRAWIALEEGDIEGAKLIYQTWQAFDSRCLTGLANIALMENDIENAQRFYLDAIQMGDRYAPNNLAVILEDIGQLSEAERIWTEDASRWDFISRKSHSNLGRVYAQQGRYDDALVHLEFALSKNEVHTFNSMGICHLNLGNLGAAEDLFQKALEHDVDNAAAMSNLGELRQVQGRLEEARDLFEKSAALGDPVARHNLGLLYLEIGDREFAILSFQKALEMGHVQAGVLLDDMNKESS